MSRRWLWVWLCYAAPVLCWGDADLANERQQLQGKHYETQWHIDCQQAQRDFLAWLDTREDRALAALLVPLKLCGVIYNTQGNHRYRDCPDFYFMEQQLTEPIELTGSQTHCAQTPLNNSHE